MKPYDHKEIEAKWQEKWAADGTYKVSDKVEGKDNFYELVEFTYPSGNLHVGHWYAYAVPDIHARYKRMQGFNVLYPIGFDAFGLPAENAAIKLGADPKIWTYEQMEKMRVQLRSMGAMFDWDREVVSCAPEYYKWTQWMFNQFLKHDLVYRATTQVNWCPKDQTILANEQVVDGKCERCGTEVIQREQPQWMLRITTYADRLIDDLDALEWPHAIKEAQKNWIGRSEGAEIDFPIEGQPEHPIKIFTTRPDTIFGATFIAISAGLAKKWVAMGWPANDEIQSYIAQTLKEQGVRDFKEKEKTGIYAGFTATNPATKEQIPVWVTNYVLSDIGTGAIMAVPAHDERDFDFAKKYNLPIKEVISKKYIFTGNDAEREGRETLNRKVVDPIIRDNEGNFYLIKEGEHHIHFAGGGVDGNETDEEALRREIIEETGFTDFEIGRKITPYITGWGYRHTKNKNQRCLGPGYEVILKSFNRVPSEIEDGKHELVKVKKEDVLKTITWEHHRYIYEQYLKGEGAFPDEGVLFNSEGFDGLTSEEAKKKIIEFVGGKLVNTYRLRDWGISRQRYWGTPIPTVYDPQGIAHPVPDEHLPWMLPIDVDHTPDGTSPLARSHELLERTEKIFGKGWKPEVETMDTFVDSTWYFYRYLDNKNEAVFASPEKMNAWMPIDLYMGGAEHTTMHLLYSRFWVKALHDLGLVQESESYKVRRNRGLILGPDGNKMSKSKGNVINPDEIVERLGADTVRMYLAFMGPYGVTTNYPWDPNGVVGVRRFLERVWKLKEKIGDGSTTPQLHKAIKKISEDIEEYKFNTSIAAMMILLNEWEKTDTILIDEYKTLLQLLAPFAPHMTEELWYEIGETTSIHLAPWPVADKTLLTDDTVTIGVQINGKVRAELTIATSASKDEIEAAARVLPRVIEYTAGKAITQVIVVPGRIINILTD